MKNIILNHMLCLDMICPILIERYVDFCISNNIKKPVNNTEIHHILPSSIWPEFKDLKKYSWNSTRLTYENHYMAHSLLASATDNKSAIYAWWKMNSGNANYKDHSGRPVLGSAKYAELRKKHRVIVRENQILRNKDKKIINKRLNTLNNIGDDGISGFKRMGKKISETLIKNGSCAGQNNSQYQKMIVKYRSKPTQKISIKPKDYNKIEHVPFQMKYILLYDNTGELYFEGWKDEAEIYCESIGLDSKKIKYKCDKIFKYKGQHSDYLMRVMRLAGLGRYIESKIIVLSDEEAEEKIMTKNKEACPL